MNTCATCAHWTEIKLDPPDPTILEHPHPTIDFCVPVELGARWGDCRAMNLDTQSRYSGEPERRLAYAQDASDYNASLRTQDRFGCVMWEKKS